jgi:hypothetical protein
MPSQFAGLFCLEKSESSNSDAVFLAAFLSPLSEGHPRDGGWCTSLM